MPANNRRRTAINNLRVVLNVFYACLISRTVRAAKQLAFRSPPLYLSVRSAVSTFCICLYSLLIIYSLWFERVGALSLVALLLLVLVVVRFGCDLYAYGAGHFEHSLYPPFERLISSAGNRTQTNSVARKTWPEELADFTGEFVVNIAAILLTVFIVRRMSRAKRHLAHAAVGIELIRRMTV